MKAPIVVESAMWQSLEDTYHSPGGSRMDLQHLTQENIARARNVFDLILLTWWEMRVGQGEIEHALASVDAGQIEPGEHAAGVLEQAISHAWAANPELAGSRDLDDGIRNALVGVLQTWEPESVLLHVMRQLERRASGMGTRYTRRLNSVFSEIGAVYAAPAHRFRGLLSGTPVPPGEYADWPAGALCDFVVLPVEDHDVSVRFSDMDRSLSMGNSVSPAQLVVGVADHCSASDGVRSVVLAEQDGLRRCLIDLVEGDDIASRVRQAVLALSNGGANVAVMPELSMNEDLLSVAVAAMRELFDQHMGQQPLRLLVAGSYHRQVNRLFVDNVSHAIGPDGSFVWSQRKMFPYQWADGGATAEEALDPRGRCLEVCDMWFGRVAGPVCLDYLSRPVRSIARHLGIDCFLVPAMTPSTEDFVEAARQGIRTSRMATAVANACHRPKAVFDEDASSFVCLPLRGREGVTVHRFESRVGPLLETVSIP